MSDTLLGAGFKVMNKTGMLPYRQLQWRGRSACHVRASVTKAPNLAWSQRIPALSTISLV